MIHLALLLFAVNYDRPLAEAFASRPGAAVVLDVTTGRILGGHNLPQAHSRRAAPGSTIKPFVWLAWNQANPGQPLPRYPCRRKLSIGGRNLDCSHPDANFPLSPREALAYSCNSFFVQLPFPNFAQALTRHGFELSPPLDPALQALGESGVTTTPIALARAYRALALQARAGSLDGNLLSGLAGAVEYGSAQLASAPGLAAAGKTGTTAGPNRAYTHAWFAGWAPAQKPEVVVVVFLEQGRGGASAAPIAQAAFRAYSQPKPASQVTVRLYSELSPQALVVNNKTYSARELTQPLHFERATIQAPNAAARTLAYPLTLAPRDGRLQATIEMPLEDYVVASLMGESLNSRNPEALRVMAILARTYAVKNRGRHASQGYDFCDTTHCQDLRLAPPPEHLVRAADSSEGELLWYNGQPAHVYYHQHCGGHTESARAVWGQSLPYLTGVRDDACLNRRRAAWSSELPLADVARALGLPALESIEILSRTPSGRAKNLLLSGRPLDASTFRFTLGRAFGWATVASNWFQVSSDGHRLKIAGFGSGHGVGLCQTGAEVRAGRGAPAEQILAFYFPGAQPGVTAQGVRWTSLHGERADLWTTNPEQDRGLLTLADQLTRRAEQLTGELIPQRPRLKHYPTLPLYRDSTGQSAQTLAATRGHVIRLQPAPQLRSQGLLESTLLHELTHIALSRRAHPQTPEWFLEGLTALLSNTATSSPYRSCARRVRTLIEQHGQAAVMTWLQKGLPN